MFTVILRPILTLVIPPPIMYATYVSRKSLIFRKLQVLGPPRGEGLIGSTMCQSMEQQGTQVVSDQLQRIFVDEHFEDNWLMNIWNMAAFEQLWGSLQSWKFRSCLMHDFLRIDHFSIFFLLLKKKRTWEFSKWLTFLVWLSSHGDQASIDRAPWSPKWWAAKSLWGNSAWWWWETFDILWPQEWAICIYMSVNSHLQHIIHSNPNKYDASDYGL